MYNESNFSVILTYFLVIKETFGDCDSGDKYSCCMQDVSCNVDCHPDNKCRYSDWVFGHKSSNYFPTFFSIFPMFLFEYYFDMKLEN